MEQGLAVKRFNRLSFDLATTAQDSPFQTFQLPARDFSNVLA